MPVPDTLYVLAWPSTETHFVPLSTLPLGPLSGTLFPLLDKTMTICKPFNTFLHRAVLSVEVNESRWFARCRAGLFALMVGSLWACGGGDSSEPEGQGGGTQDAGSNGTAGDGSDDPDIPSEPFSFFVTSLAAMQRLSGSESGFGGDLRYGEADGLSGADKICREIAEYSMPGAGAKTWRAFLSVTAGPDGNPVNAIDRIGDGPWYDRLGRLVAANLTDLANTRPVGADPDIVNDLPNEDGVPNHRPDPTQPLVDNHDVLTGTDDQGRLYSNDSGSTCRDWTSSIGSDGQPRCGHSWPRGGGGGGFDRGGDGGMENWMSALDEAGCAAGVNLVETGGPSSRNPTVGSGGGYGGIYCFATDP